MRMYGLSSRTLVARSASRTFSGIGCGTDPASSSNTFRPGSADRRDAITKPAEPPPAPTTPQSSGLLHLRGDARSLPFHAQLLKAPAIFQSGSIGAAQMELLSKIERQLLWTLRFDNSFVLLEDTPVLRVQLLVGFYVTIVAAG